MLLASPLWWKEGYSLTWEAKGLYSERWTEFTDTDCASASPSSASARILRVSDIPSSRCLFLLRVSERRIDATGFTSLLRTPSAHDSRHYKWSIEYTGGGTLAEEIKEYHNLGRANWEKLFRDFPEIMRRKDAGEDFHLSPLLSQEMMGFPVGWTEKPFQISGMKKASRPSETP